MNPANPDFSNRTASSPALFNRCVIDWFGEWSLDGVLQVAKELTKYIDIPNDAFTKSEGMEETEESDPKHEGLCTAIMQIHSAVKDLNAKSKEEGRKYNFITPRDFLDFIKHFVELFNEKKEELEEQQYHLNQGLTKLRETEEAVIEMQAQLSEYEKTLNIKEKEASDKLQMILKEQKIAEEQKSKSILQSEELVKQQGQVAEQTEVANRDLSKAEPALIAA